ETYAVDIAVPPEGVAGNYTLRLDVQGEDVPDRSHVQGPTVTFEVPAAAPPPPPRRFPWWIAAVIGLMVIAGIAFFLLRPRTVLVPEVSGQELVSGLSILDDTGLEVAQPLTQRTSNSVDALHIIGTVPASGESVASGSEVEVIVSTGRGEIVCVRFPCNPFDEIVNGQLNEAIRLEQAPDGGPQIFFDMEMLREVQ
ncbi:MAG TPA: PASTA domain-containing protein, partial [Trueperaceae bacterium]|nr:PASTA domain-containing protein [Trueperaceae bacterium]